MGILVKGFGLAGGLRIRVAQVRDRAWIVYYTCCLKLKLKAFGCSYGPRLKANGPVRIHVQKSGSIRLGACVSFVSRADRGTAYCALPVTLQTLGEGHIVFGDGSGAAGAFLSARSSITIGRNVLIGLHSKIIDHDFHSTDASQRRKEVLPEVIRTSPIALGDDTFVGMESIILRGVRAGRRVLIFAGSVVALRAVPDDSVLSGNPARIIWVRPATES
jgi:acetyltransferase-like isoleucine patch superfamily enzyme